MQNANTIPRDPPGALEHPSADEWMAFVYGELPGARQRDLDAHLRRCSRCQASVGRWRSTMAGLGRWQLTPTQAHARRAASHPVLRWGVAAALVLGLGFGAGRLTAPPPDLDALRAALAADISEHVRQELAADWEAALQGGTQNLTSDFRLELRAGLDQWRGETVAQAAVESERQLAEFIATTQAQRRQDQQFTLALFASAEERHQAQHLNLRRALETVAVMAADQFQRTETQIGELASFTQAKLIPDPSGNFEPLNSSNLNHD